MSNAECNKYYWNTKHLYLLLLKNIILGRINIFLDILQDILDIFLTRYPTWSLAAVLPATTSLSNESWRRTQGSSGRQPAKSL